MKILVAFEESQTVTREFRKLGHEAFSADIMPAENMEWHIRGDVTPLFLKDWDMIIAFPPCTHLCVSGARHFDRKEREQKIGIAYFMLAANSKCPKVAIENPVGIMSTVWRKPDQIINPYQFGDPYKKRTCLWLKGLPKLLPTKIVDKGEQRTTYAGKGVPAWYADSYNLSKKERARVRSKTFPGIAKAMAQQWGRLTTKAHLAK